MTIKIIRKILGKVRFVLYGILAILTIGFTSGFYAAWRLKPKVTDYYTVVKPTTIFKTQTLYRTKTKYKTVYVPPEGHVEVKPKDPEKKLEDVVEVKIKWYGLTFGPGLQFGALNIGYGLDFKLAYINRFGFNTGVLFYPKKSGRGLGTITPSMGLSYRLDRLPFVRNTEAQCAWTPLGPSPANCGLRIGF